MEALSTLDLSKTLMILLITILPGVLIFSMILYSDRKSK